MSMRQRDKYFITVLNKMRLNEQTNDDIEYINSHCYRSPPIDPLFPYLFYKNKDVQIHNEKMLSQVDEELLILEHLMKLKVVKKNSQLMKKRLPYHNKY